MLARWGLVVVLLAVLGCAGGPDPAPAPEPPTKPMVILLSLDGLRHDFPDRGELPALQQMAREGRRGRLVPSWPSNTFPGHVTMATGVPVAGHGIVDNNFRQRQPDGSLLRYSYENDGHWLRAEPLWITATRQGLHAATFFWVGSGSPWQGMAQRYARAPFDGGVGEGEKVRQILAWLDLPEAERPQLVMAWWHGVDTVAHRMGPAHRLVQEQLAAQDKHLADLIAGITERGYWSQTTLLVVADHGMADTDRGIDTRTALAHAGIEALVDGGPAVVNIYLEDQAQTAAAETVLRNHGARVYRRGALPAHWQMDVADRNGDLVAVVDPPYRLSRAGRAAQVLPDGRLRWQLDRPVGGHGYDPELPEMHAALLAMGRGVCPGPVLAPARNTRVAATVAELLGITPPPEAAREPIPLCP